MSAHQQRMTILALLCGLLVVGVIAVAAQPSSWRDPAHPCPRAVPGLSEKTAVLIPVASEPSWQEFAYLAAIPASSTLSGGAPSVIALDQFGVITDEVQDYLNRYLPSATYLIGREAEWSQGHWELNEGSGSTAVDSSTNGYDGTIYGATWVDGSLEFDGLDDYVEIPGYTGISGSNGRTVAAWIRTTQADGEILAWGQRVLFGEPTIPGGRWVLRVQEDGFLSLDLGGAHIAGGTDLRDGEWHHVSATLADGAVPCMSNIKLYVDGEPETISQMSDSASGSLKDFLAGYWRMNEGAGNTISDSSSGGSSGLFHTDVDAGGDFPDWGAGLLGSGLYFDRNDYIEIANESHFDGTYDAFSVQCWLKHDWTWGTTANDRFVTKGSQWQGGWVLARCADAPWAEVAAAEESLCSDALAPVGVWHQVVGTYDGTTMRLYVDGTERGAQPIGEITGNDVPVRIASGDWCGGPSGGGLYGGRFGGWMDEVAVWNRALTDDEVTELYNGGAGLEIDTTFTTIDTLNDACVRIGVLDGSDAYFEGVIEDVRIYDRALSDTEIMALKNHRSQDYTGLTELPAGSLDEVCCHLAETFWTTADHVVLCDGDDYPNALAASALAGRLQVPLLFFGTDFGLSAEALAIIGGLGATSALLVGENPAVVGQLAGIGVSATELSDAPQVIGWMLGNDLAVDYLAIVNPKDRSLGMVRKSSLAGPLLATGREGAVALLTFDTDWKHPFWYSGVTESQPPGAPASATGHWYVGEMSLGENTYNFVIANTNDNEHYNLLNIDFNSNGDFGDPGEGPFESADVVEIEGKRYAVSIGTSGAQTPGHIKFTYPSAEEMKENLSSYYSILGAHPEYLCVVGLYDALPFGLANGYYSYNSVEDLPTDALIADVDDDPFYEIAVGRVLGETRSFATLLAARSLTYDDLIGDPDVWARRAMWVGTFWGQMFMVPHKLENVGFYPTVIQEDDPDYDKSLLSVVVQDDHGGPGGMGGGWDYTLETPLAPCVLEVGGCDTGGIDEDALDRLVVVRMLRKGAIAYIGTQRGTPADKRQYRQDFWNTVTSGRTLGEAHRRGLNSMMTTILEGASDAHYYEYCHYSEAFYGDPALAIHIPSEPAIEPAHVEASGVTLTAVAPEEFWFDEGIDYLGDYWYYYSGAGMHPAYDMSIKYMLAEWRTDLEVAGLWQDPSVPVPLGWPTGDYYIDEHWDGTRSVYWRVRFLEFDRSTGEITQQAERIDYTLLGGSIPVVMVTSPNGGEFWIAGQEHDVTWRTYDDVGVTGIDIYYSTDGGATYPHVVSTDEPDDGIFTWVPDTPSAHCRVKVVAHDADAQTGEDVSNTDFVITISEPQLIYDFPMDADPGWNVTPGSEWQFGGPTGQGGASHGNPDPTSGATGLNVYGVNLNGDYSIEIGGPYSLTVGPLDLTLATSVRLKFQRWLNTDYQPYVYATLRVSTDGSTWTTLWQNGGSEITDASWLPLEYDISSVADGQSDVYIRWGYEVGTDGAFPYSGWNIDDVEIWGILPVPGNADGDGDADLDDYAYFAECLGGPGAAPDPTPPTTAQECLDAFDFVPADGDVDLADFTAFQTAFTGS